MLKPRSATSFAVVMTLVFALFPKPSLAQGGVIKKSCIALFDLASEKVKKHERLQDGLIWSLEKILSRRYPISTRDVGANTPGIGDIQSRGTKSIVFLFEHPGFIDPALFYGQFGRTFHPRPLVIEEVFDGLGPVVKAVRALSIPRIEKHREDGAALIDKVVDEVAAGLSRGENFMLAPSGEIKSENFENIQNQSIVDKIVKKYPHARIVMVRSFGIYGSRFTTGFNGKRPSFDFKSLYKYVNGDTVSAWLRKVPRPARYEIKEAFDFPRTGTRFQINKYLNDFMNEGKKENIYAPLKKGQRILVAPAVLPLNKDQEIKRDPQEVELINAVPDDIRAEVLRDVNEVMESENIKADDRTDDLAIDSLDLAKITALIEAGLNIRITSNRFPQTVEEIMQIANTARLVQEQKIKDIPDQIVDDRIDPRWLLAEYRERAPWIPKSNDVLEAFYKKAREMPDEIAMKDERLGALTYRDLVMSISALSQQVRKLDGKNIGILMPASNAVWIFILATLDAGKNPVIINFSQKDEVVLKGANSLNIKHVLSSSVFIDRLHEKHLAVDSIIDRITTIESMKESLTKLQGARALVTAMFKPFWRRNPLRLKSKYSVILFTSGSTGVPKAVGLTSKNQLTNIREAFALFDFFKTDKLAGILPPFHSFGATGTGLMPLLSGLPNFQFAAATEFFNVAQTIVSHHLTVLMGTPEFLVGIAGKARPGGLPSLRLIMAGADKLSKESSDIILRAAPNAIIIEGYGITETSPILAVNPPQRPIPQTLGEVLPSVDFAIVDPDTLEPKPSGEPGMLYVRGPSVFGGYLNTKQNPFGQLKIAREKKSWLVRFSKKEQYYSDWYRTEDMVVEISPRHLKMLGRLDRMRKLNQEQFYLPVIESEMAPIFANAPAGEPAYVVESVGHEEPLVLFTSVKFGNSPEEARTLIRQKQKELGMSPVLFISEVRYVEHIPVLGTGKADWKTLEKQLIAEHEAKKSAAPTSETPKAPQKAAGQ